MTEQVEGGLSSAKDVRVDLVLWVINRILRPLFSPLSLENMHYYNWALRKICSRARYIGYRSSESMSPRLQLVILRLGYSRLAVYD